MKHGRGKSVGTAWIWTACAPAYRLTLAAVVGNRNLFAARRLLRAIRRGFARGTWPLFPSDALRHDAQGLLEAFGVWRRFPRTGTRGRPRKPARAPHPLVAYAQVNKQRAGGRVGAVTRSVIFGNEAALQPQAQTLRRANGRKGRITTAYVERNNLTLREENGRLSRKTLAFSKNRRALHDQGDCWRAYANLARAHRALRSPANPASELNRWVAKTPAMAAGITDHIWSLEELLTFRHRKYQP